VRAGREAERAHPRRVEIVGAGVGAQPPDRAAHVVHGRREHVARRGREPVADRRGRVPARGEQPHGVVHRPPVAALPASPMQQHHGRVRAGPGGAREVEAEGVAPGAA
jgi:hypothetical protein